MGALLGATDTASGYDHPGDEAFPFSVDEGFDLTHNGLGYTIPMPARHDLEARVRAWRVARDLDKIARLPEISEADALRVKKASSAITGRKQLWPDVADALAAADPSTDVATYEGRRVAPGAAVGFLMTTGNRRIAWDVWGTAIDAWHASTTDRARSAALRPLCKSLGVSLPDDASLPRLLRKHRAGRRVGGTRKG
jgi:hypothetical protein